MLKLDTILDLGRSMSVKREKDDDDSEIVSATLKFTGLAVNRDSIDELMGSVDIGWSSHSLFDEQGAPIRMLTLSLDGTQLSVTGTISGANGQPRLPLMQAQLTAINVTLGNLGGTVSGTLSWKAKGDEVEDVSDLLGKTCKAVFDIRDGQQADMLRQTLRNVTVEFSRGDAEAMGGQDDELYSKAVEAVRRDQKASISHVQSWLMIGYNRAARLIEAMEAAGVVGPMQASGSREVLGTERSQAPA